MLRKLGLLLILLPIFGLALPMDELEKSQNLVGEIHYQKWFFDVYDAQLYTSDKKFSWDKPFLLKLSYLRDLSGKAIATQTAKEIKKQDPKLSKKKQKEIKAFFSACLPNVEKGDVLYGYVDADKVGHIYASDRQVCDIQDKTLTRYFFNIWLSDKSSDRKLSRKLRGL